MSATITRIGAALGLGVSGWVHAELYVHGYRAIPGVGPMFLLQASGALAVAVLLLVTGPVIPRLGAAGLSAGALVGFVLSRTVGVLGFVEHGFDPAPQALISVLAEVATLLLLAVGLATGRAQARRPGGHWQAPPSPSRPRAGR